ncbi:MAG TPA: FAD-dependent oxidoreductase [Hyphomicrobiaceae bacterium]|nr:FAD-dependent oxidoreductase [Hyphomicrobiaceae bacterium]
MHKSDTRSITIVGAGIVGLWQALMLARRGFEVRLVERSHAPFATAASALAGAMLAPYCEAEAAEPVVRELGLRSLAMWRATFPGVTAKGTLVVAGTRDRAELVRFARMTDGFDKLDAEALHALEPGLEARFAAGLFYAEEAHMVPAEAMAFILDAARAAGVEATFGTPWSGEGGDGGTVIDCRGMAARGELPGLRGVRGERVVVETREVKLERPVRLLHPRHPLYVVPWTGGRYMIGATVIESDDESPMTVRSALELLGSAYALHPAFAEAQVVELAAGVRPAFADNVPKIVVRDRTIYVNGLYRHGFLMSPVLGELVADYLATGAVDARVFRVE